jgi:hypothetical protein
VDFTLQRTFKLTERFSLKTSADFFNIFNHPNFRAPINCMTSPQFGFSTQTLNSWLGSGGLIRFIRSAARASSNSRSSIQFCAIQLGEN